MTHGSTESNRVGFTIGYDLGLVGTWVRIAIGIVASAAVLVIDLSSVSSEFLLETVGWFIAILVAYMAVFALLASRVLPRLNPWISTVVFYGPVLVLPYVEALPDTFRVSLSLYVTVSIVVVILVRYGGCEVVGIPSLILRRRYVVYCPWNTVDLVDKAIEDSRWSALLQGISFKVVAILVAIAIVAVGGSLLNEAFPLIWFAAALGSVLTVGIAILLTSGRSRGSGHEPQRARGAAPKDGDSMSG